MHNYSAPGTSKPAVTWNFSYCLRCFEFRGLRLCNTDLRPRKCVSERPGHQCHFLAGKHGSHPTLVLSVGFRDKEKGLLGSCNVGQSPCSIHRFLVLCSWAFSNDTGHFNGAEQAISLANRVTALSDKFAVQCLEAMKPFQSALCPWMVS